MARTKIKRRPHYTVLHLAGAFPVELTERSGTFEEVTRGMSVKDESRAMLAEFEKTAKVGDVLRLEQKFAIVRRRDVRLDEE